MEEKNVYLVSFKTPYQFGILMSEDRPAGYRVAAFTTPIDMQANKLRDEAIEALNETRKYGNPLHFFDEVEVNFHMAPEYPGDLEQFGISTGGQATPLFLRGIPYTGVVIAEMDEEKFISTFPSIFNVNTFIELNPIEVKTPVLNKEQEILLKVGKRGEA